MTYTLIPNIWYTITPETDCDLATPNGISIHLPAGIQYFHFADSVSIDISGTATVTQNPPLFKPASASALGGGYIESNLNVGHGATDAVAAQCSLTPGDLATGGTLADSNGQSVELGEPHKYAEGYLVFRDATEACTLTIGEWSKTWEEKTDAKASGTFAVMGDEGTIGVANGGEVYPVQVPDDPTSVAGWNQSFTAAGCGIVCTAADPHGEIDVSVEAAEVGEDGNGIEIAVGSYEPVTLAGGSTARTKQDVVDALNGDADCPVHASLDADEEAISLTAKEYGVNDAISAEGDMFSNWSGMSGGHGDYSVAELVTAIAGEFDDITPAAGETEDTITLTANTAGAAANAITYTATGCFGSGTTKQGSTTRGKNEVTQTAFKIYLNGVEITGGGSITVDPTPTQGSTNAVSSGGVYTASRELPAPTPEPLEEDTVMKNGGVYTVVSSIDAREVSLADNATSHVIVSSEGGAIPTVQWPAWRWCSSDGMPPTFDYFRVYRIAVEDDGFYTAARLVSDYATARNYPYTPLTPQNYTSTNLELFLVPGETSVEYGVGADAWNAFAGSGKKFQTFAAGVKKNMLNEALPLDGLPSGYNVNLTCLLTFRTARAMKIRGVVFSIAGFNAEFALQGWDGENWVTCGHAQNTGGKRIIVSAATIATDKWRIVLGEQGQHEMTLADVKIFEQV